jgi:hypothetical protein
MLLKSGEYRYRGAAGVQNLYLPQHTDTQSSAQSVMLNTSLRFEALAVTDVSEPAVLSMFALGLLGLSLRRSRIRHIRASSDEFW